MIKMTKLEELEKTTNGITLIALVITIIVLLILAGVSIATLTGENGILTKATKAGKESKKASAKEKLQIAVMGSFGLDGELDTETLNKNLNRTEGIDKEKSNFPVENLPTTVVVDDYLVTIDKKGQVTIDGKFDELTMPSTTDTTPFLPEGATIIRNNPQSGIVIRDQNENEWVWVEVPKSIYNNTTYNGGTAPTSSEDYTKIESIMQKYAKDYRLSSWEDIFFNTEQHGFEDSTEYINHKNTMLKSVFENGGFYVGRYEVGKSEKLSTTPLVQKDRYPYNGVTSLQAQEKATELATGGKKASLMFGIQWDLMLKYMEEKGAKTREELTTSSESFGNYKNASFIVKRGLYKEGETWHEILATNPYMKSISKEILLSTGSSNRNCVLGIYDLAGNVAEYTLEKSWSYGSPCSLRGGHYRKDSATTISIREINGMFNPIMQIGFRPVLW